MLRRLYNYETDPDSPSHFDLRDALGFARRNLLLVASITALAILIGYIHLARQIPYYTASAIVLLDPRKERAPGGPEALSRLEVRDSRAVDSQIAVIRSISLLRRVVKKLNLVRDSEFGFGGQQPKASWSLSGAVLSLFSSAKSDKPAAPKNNTGPDAFAATVRALSGAVSAKRMGRSYVLRISATSRDRKKAGVLANAVADAYLVDILQARFEAAKRASGWLSDRLVELRKQLRESEEAVFNFRTKNGLVRTGNKITLTQQQLGALNTRLMASRADVAEKKALFDQLKAVRAKKGNLSALPDVMRSSTIGALRAQLSSVSQREADLVARYGKRHPQVVNVRAEKRDVQRAIRSEIFRISDNVENEYRLALTRQKSIEKTFAEVTGQGNVDDKTQIRLRELERTAAVNKTLFEEFLQKAKISGNQASFQAQEARILTPARAGRQSFPNRNRTLLLATLLGLAFGVGAAYARETLNTGFMSAEQVERTLGVPLLASVNHLKSRDLTIDGQQHQPHYFNKIRPLSRYSESIRAIRSGIQMADVDSPIQVVQITSALPSEGKSTIALSLAVSAGGAGQRVLIIDADLRNPSTTRNLSMEKEPGLVDYLTGSIEISTAVKFIENLNISAMPAGAKTTNPSDLLGSQRMKSMLEALRESYDYIIVDTPPVGPLIDPCIVSRLVDKAVVIVKWGVTDREAVQNSIRKLDGHKLLAGVVFNFVDDRQVRRYARYSRGGYYDDKTYSKYFDD